MRILTYTTLFPNKEMPNHGIFVAERLRHLLGSGEVEATVVAPVPWFPSRHELLGRYARYARVPSEERRLDTTVRHPRYPAIPKVGMTLAPLLMALASWRAVAGQAGDGAGFDLIDAHYIYPDGVAAALLARWLKKAVVITGRGTDLNLIPEYTLPRRMILWAAKEAAAMATVSDSLRRVLVDDLGVPDWKVRTLRNGVDLELFRPLPDRYALRRRLGVTETCLLSVGHLVERKGHHFVIEALGRLPAHVHAIIVGSGPWEQRLKGLAADAAVSHRVRFTGRLSHTELVHFYNAADALVLASSREGMANVLLESLACGTPVVATEVWGTPEVVDDPVAGELVSDRSGRGIAEGVKRLLARHVRRDAVRRHAERFSWDATTAGQLEMFRQALGRAGR